jgi:Tfp pilus assembly protein PilN
MQILSIVSITRAAGQSNRGNRLSTAGLADWACLYWRAQRRSRRRLTLLFGVLLACALLLGARLLFAPSQVLAQRFG